MCFGFCGQMVYDDQFYLMEAVLMFSNNLLLYILLLELPLTSCILCEDLDSKELRLKNQGKTFSRFF